MELSPPVVGALTGLVFVSLLALIARRSEQRALEQRLQILREKIRRREAKLAEDAGAVNDRDGDAPYNEEGKT